MRDVKRIFNLRKYILALALLVMLLIPGVAQAKPVDIHWYEPYFRGAAQIELPADDAVDNSFSFNGRIDAGYRGILVHVLYQALDVYYYYPAKGNEVAGQVYLRFGQGNYQVEMNLVKPSTDPSLIEFDSLAWFGMEKRDLFDKRYLLPSWGIESDNEQIIKLAKEITKDAKTDYLKVKAVHDWVARNIKYDVAKYKENKLYDNDGAVQALQTKQGLCRDYSNLATALLRALNLEARTVIGQAQSNGQWYGHAWNEAKVGGRWVAFDATWDAGYIRNDQFVAKYSNKYFDMAPEKFKQTHSKSENLF